MEQDSILSTPAQPAQPSQLQASARPHPLTTGPGGEGPAVRSHIAGGSGHPTDTPPVAVPGLKVPVPKGPPWPNVRSVFITSGRQGVCPRWPEPSPGCSWWSSDGQGQARRQSRPLKGTERGLLDMTRRLQGGSWAGDQRRKLFWGGARGLQPVRSWPHPTKSAPGRGPLSPEWLARLAATDGTGQGGVQPCLSLLGLSCEDLHVHCV